MRPIDPASSTAFQGRSFGRPQPDHRAYGRRDTDNPPTDRRLRDDRRGYALGRRSTDRPRARIEPSQPQLIAPTFAAHLIAQTVSTNPSLQHAVSAYARSAAPDSTRGGRI